MMGHNRKYLLFAVLMALFTGIIHIIPHLYSFTVLPPSKYAIFPFQSADEEHYDVSIKATMEGYGASSNYYIREGRKATSGAGFVLKSERILGIIGRSLGLSIRTYVILMRFLFPAIAFLLIYAIFRSLDISPNASLFWAMLNLVAPYIFYLWFEPVMRPVFTVLRDNGFNLLWYEQYAGATLPYARMVNPQFSGLFFLGAMVSLVYLIRGKQRILWGIILAVLAFINFRLYFYFWSSLGAIIVFFFIFSIALKNKKALLPLGIIMLAGLIIGLPRALRLVKMDSDFPSTHWPIFSPGCLAAIIVLFLAVLYYRRKKPGSVSSVILFTMPLIVLVTMNQNVITGRIVQPWHYELFTTPLFLSMALAILVRESNCFEGVVGFLKRKNEQSPAFSYLLRVIPAALFFLCGVILFFFYFKLAVNYTRAMLVIACMAVEVFILFLVFQTFLFALSNRYDMVKLLKVAALFIMAIVIFEGLSRQSVISVKTMRRAEEIRYLAQPFRWLNENTPENSTVLSSFDVSERIPLFTHNTVYLCKNVMHERIAKEHRRERSLNYFILTGHDAEEFRSKLNTWPYGFLFWGLNYPEPKKDLYSFGLTDPVSQDKVNNIIQDYKDKKDEKMDKIIAEYNLDYIFHGPKERNFFQKKPEEFLPVKKVYELQNVIIYEVIPEKGEKE